MPTSPVPEIAVVADAHFHDVDGDYGVGGITVANRRLTLRPLADTIKSTRVFNESGRALRHTLDDIARRGIRHVVLLGDYSDDGQIATLSALRGLLQHYETRWGMRFITTPGNHDLYAVGGRHRTKRFLNAHGGYDVASSDPRSGDGTTITDTLRGAGYAESLLMLGRTSLFRSAGDLHWETPFGSDDALPARHYRARSPDGRTERRIIDASYLVEPFNGVWLLMIDANVFVPRDGGVGDGEDAFCDSSAAGWNAMMSQKKFVFDWAADIAVRARAAGKTLIAFSHYPALDPLDGTASQERRLIGETSLLKRIPQPDVGAALIAAGISVHFSGHLHVNDTARMQTSDGALVNVAVPSLVAFPAGYKILRVEGDRLAVESVSISGLGMDAAIQAAYRIEVGTARLASRGLHEAMDYGDFLVAHLERMINRRHLKREWPVDLVEAARRMTLGDLVDAPGKADRDMALPVMMMVLDWYRARMASDPGLAGVGPDRRETYRRLAKMEPRPGENAHGAKARLRELAGMIEVFLSGLPSRDFVIQIGSGSVEAC